MNAGGNGNIGDGNNEIGDNGDAVVDGDDEGNEKDVVEIEI